ncbi:MAG: hypothetical protein M3405_08250 [Acidobacteriota bacterium]|jgi:hypothetical protein|nr:hypothetical protein [Acidobacteriota bacterium]
MNNIKAKEKRRTTLTLEADINSEIQRKLRENPTLKEKTLVNELLRRGLNAIEEESKSQKLRIKPFKTRRVKGVTDNQIEEMLKEI